MSMRITTSAATNMIAGELAEAARALAGDRKIADVRCGLGYTGVMLDDGAGGVAYTFRADPGGHCGVIDEAGTLIGKDAAEVIGWAESGVLVKASVGVAAINAVLNDAQKDYEAGNVIQTLDVGEADTFGMVGEFRPILAAVREKTKNIYVFEQNVKAGGMLHPSEDIPAFLPKCDVVVVTATSIINHTIDEILPQCQKARAVCLVGPSTTICPDVLGKYGVTLLAGSIVSDAPRVLDIVSQGGGTMAMKPAIRQVLVPVRR